MKDSKVKNELYWRKFFGYLFFTVFIIIYGLLLHKLFEVITMLAAYTVFRTVFKNQLHFLSQIFCIGFSIILFFTIIQFMPRNIIGFYYSLLWGFAINLFTYIINIVKSKQEKKKYKIRRGMGENELIELVSHCGDGVDEREYQILKLFYCKKKTLYQIGDELNYAPETISRIKKETLERLVG